MHFSIAFGVFQHQEIFAATFFNKSIDARRGKSKKKSISGIKSKNNPIELRRKWREKYMNGIFSLFSTLAALNGKQNGGKINKYIGWVGQKNWDHYPNKNRCHWVQLCFLGINKICFECYPIKIQKIPSNMTKSFQFFYRDVIEDILCDS